MKTREFEAKWTRAAKKGIVLNVCTSFAWQGNFAPLFLRYVLTLRVKGERCRYWKLLIKRGKQGVPCISDAQTLRVISFSSDSSRLVLGGFLRRASFHETEWNEFCTRKTTRRRTRSRNQYLRFPYISSVTTFRGSVCSLPIKSRKYANTGTKFRNYLNSATNKRSRDVFRHTGATAFFLEWTKHR